MQTQPRPPETVVEADVETNAAARASVRQKLWQRCLNVGLALSGLGLYLLYITKGAELYSYFPGGRKFLFAAAAFLFFSLLITRLYPIFKQPALKLWRNRAGLLSLPSSASALAGFIFVLALLVRSWGVNFGLPYLEQVDEWNVAERALHMVQTGNFDPLDYRHPPLADNDRQAFTYPTLYTYLQTGLFSARFLQGVAAGRYDSTSNLNSPLVKADFYEWGRGLTALLGAGAALLVFLIGRRYYGARVGLTAALFLGFFYLHVLNSHWLTTDVPSSFFALLPFFWIYRLGAGEGSEKRDDYLLAGLFCGLAMGTKYNNLVIILPLLLAHLMSRPPRRWVNWHLPLALGATFVGFFASSPFVFFHLPNFLTDLAAVLDHYQNRGHSGFEGTANWQYFIAALWSENALVVGLGLAGVGLLLVRHRRQDIVLLSFPLFSYIQLSSYKVNFSRNLMPLIPFLCIFAAVALVGLVEFGLKPKNLIRWQVPLLSVLALAAIISPALTILQYDRYNSQPTNRTRALNWAQANLPRGSKIWIEPFSLELLPRTSYRVEGGKGILEHPPEWYAANGYNYLVLSEAYYKEAYDTGKPDIRQAYRELIEGPRPVGLSLIQDFPKNNLDRPGPRVLILATNLPTVAASPLAYQISRSLQLDFGGKIRLIGADVPDNARPGASLPLVLYWQSLSPSRQDYTTFIHLLDSTNKIVAQLDLPPLSGTRPTSSWQPGQVLRDEYPLTLPANLPSGEYRLTLGLYIPPNGERLGLPVGGDEAEIARLKIQK